MFSLVLPTYNESENLPELLPKICEAFEGTEYEILIVDDDSPDETWAKVRDIDVGNADIRVIRRIGRRGLSSAVIEGFLAAKGDVFGVMDADGQHDTTLLPKLFAAAQENKALAMGTRYVEGGGVGDWNQSRHRLSMLATKLTHICCGVRVSDPMSGFFAVHRSLFEKIVKKLNPKGFKILLDILMHAPSDVKVAEIPYTFATRLHGESKLSWRVQLDFLEYLYDASVGRYVPLTFLKYCIVGSIGVIVHLCTYQVASRFLFDVDSILTLKGFSLSVLTAIEVAIVFNFMMNNMWTFARTRLTGLAAFWGFLKFNAACLFGALANFAVSAYLYSAGFAELLSVIAGAVVGVAWNYTINRMATWRS